MAVTATENTQTATVGTEHAIFQSTGSGTYVCEVNVNNMADGDILELRAKVMDGAGGTVRTVGFDTRTDAQHADDMVAVSIPYSTDLSDTGAVTFSLKQTTGTGRNYKHRVKKLAS